MGFLLGLLGVAILLISTFFSNRMQKNHCENPTLDYVEQDSSLKFLDALTARQIFM